VIEIAGVLGHILKKDGLFAKYGFAAVALYPDSVKILTNLDEFLYEYSCPRLQYQAGKKGRSTKNLRRGHQSKWKGKIPCPGS